MMKPSYQDVLNKGKRQTLPDVFNIDGTNIEDKQTISNRFNTFYVNIGPSLAKNILSTEKSPIAYMAQPSLNSIYFWDTDETEISNIITTLKNSSPG